MKSFYLTLLCLALPLVSSIVTYTFVSVGNQAIPLDDSQALLVMIALIKMLILGSTGVFPISLNNIFAKFFGRSRRGEFILYKVPPVAQFPCSRRLLCEVEAAARSSDSYDNPYPKEEVNGRILEEEVSPEAEDPLTEMHIEAVKAFYREDEKLTELTPVTRRALGLVEDLTGRSCERAYRLCPGRFTSDKLFRSIFEELSYVAEDDMEKELSTRMKTEEY